MKKTTKKQCSRRFDTIKHYKLYIIDFKCGAHFDMVCAVLCCAVPFVPKRCVAKVMESVRFVEMVEDVTQHLTITITNTYRNADSQFEAIPPPTGDFTVHIVRIHFTSDTPFFHALII